MSDAVRVKMEAQFLLRTVMPDWRDDHDLDVAMRVLGALFEEFDVSFEGRRIGGCTCSMDAEDFMTTGHPSTTDPACPWHGDER